METAGKTSLFMNGRRHKMGLLDSLKRLFNRDEESQAIEENYAMDEVALEIDEEDKLIVALAASIMAGKDKPDSHFHISSIKRVN